MELSREGRLVPLLDDLLTGRAPEICEVDPNLTPDVERRIATTAYATKRRDWKAVEQSIRPVAERHPEWAGPNFDLGLALAGMGRGLEAEAFHRRAIHANSQWPEPRGQIVKLLLTQGQTGKASEVAEEGLVEIPHWGHGHLLLARCFSQLGRAEEARSRALRAAELNPALASAAEEFI